MNIRDRIKELRRVPADQLQPNPKNWRKHPESQANALRGVLAEVGIASAVLARETPEGGLMLIDGHLRTETLHNAEIPVLVLDVTEEEADKILATFDPLGAMAESDADALRALLEEVETGSQELADMLTALAEDAGILDGADAAEIVEDEVPEPPVDPITKPGDLWILGEHRLLCGDSTKAEDVERLMAGAKLSMAFTSPPYASQRKYDESSGFRPIHPDHYVEWFAAIQENVRTHCVESASWFVNIKEHAEDGQRHLYVKDLAIAHVRRWGWMLVDELCWYKRSLPGQWPDRFRNDWEPVFHFATAKGFPFNPLAVASESDDAFHYVPNSGKTAGGNIGIGKEGRNRSTGLARPGNVLEISTRKVPNGIAHEAAFPPDLPVFFIKAYSDKGDNVYEPFCGSGTTLIAAEQLGRKCYGMEISPQYCDVIVKRWETLTGRQATREGAK
jgi:ParB-like chromosome segregation protein Spo0J